MTKTKSLLNSFRITFSIQASAQTSLASSFEKYENILVIYIFGVETGNPAWRCRLLLFQNELQSELFYSFKVEEVCKVGKQVDKSNVSVRTYNCNGLGVTDKLADRLLLLKCYDNKKV